MSSRDEFGGQSPGFEQPDGVDSFGEDWTVPLGDLHPSGESWARDSTYNASTAPEHTLPMVDLYPTSETWPEASPYLMGDDYGKPDSVYDRPRAVNPAPYQAVGQQQPPQPTPWMQQLNPYGQQPSPYGQQPGAYMVRPEHPQANTVLVLGAVSVGVPVLSFVAWYMGAKAKGEISRGAPYAYSGNLKTGHILGKVIGILTIVGASLYGLFMVAYLVIMFSLLAI